MKIGIVISLRKDPDLAGTRGVIRRLQTHGAEVMIESKVRGRLDEPGVRLAEDEEIGALSDCILAVGGDGTFLRAAHIATPRRTPILGINRGRLGYLSEIETGETELLERLFTGEYNIENRMMVRAEVRREGRIAFSGTGLNEAVVQNGRTARVLEFEISADGSTVGRYRADGVILATPTGSTAYALAAGGPIMDPLMQGLLMVPICPHALGARAVLFSDRAALEIRIPFLKNREAILAVDGGNTFALEENDVVRVARAAEETRMIRLKHRSFHEILNSKL